MAAAVQLLILASIGLIAIAAMLFVADIARLARQRAPRRRLMTLAGFHAGALVVGWVAWRMLKPTDWTLSFWTTVQAGVDSETYGHVVEHAAEVLAASVIVLAAVGGLLIGGLAWISQRRPSFANRHA
jgi:hypothetical protein